MSSTPQSNAPYVPAATLPRGDASRSAVSWSAVFAGAVIAAALSAALITGGTGLGFLAVSPWEQDGASATTLAVSTIAWLLVTQIIAYGIAGYVTGRLRTKWTDTHRDEIFFRDTAHGFLVWALSAVVGAVLLGSALTSIGSGAAKASASLIGAGASAIGTAAEKGSEELSLDYFTDNLLRPADPALRGSGDERQEVTRILTRGIVEGKLSDDDRNYLVQLVAQRTGVDPATAEQRLDAISKQAQQAIQDAEQAAREAADTARKAAAALALWLFASLLIGAFVASFSATIGGRARDR